MVQTCALGRRGEEASSSRDVRQVLYFLISGCFHEWLIYCVKVSSLLSSSALRIVVPEHSFENALQQCITLPCIYANLCPQEGAEGAIEPINNIHQALLHSADFEMGEQVTGGGGKGCRGGPTSGKELLPLAGGSRKGKSSAIATSAAKKARVDTVVAADAAGGVGVAHTDAPVPVVEAACNTEDLAKLGPVRRRRRASGTPRTNASAGRTTVAAGVMGIASGAEGVGAVTSAERGVHAGIDTKGLKVDKNVRREEMENSSGQGSGAFQKSKKTTVTSAENRRPGDSPADAMVIDGQDPPRNNTHAHVAKSRRGSASNAVEVVDDDEDDHNSDGGDVEDDDEEADDEEEGDEALGASVTSGGVGCGTGGVSQRRRGSEDAYMLIYVRRGVEWGAVSGGRGEPLLPLHVQVKSLFACACTVKVHRAWNFKTGCMKRCIEPGEPYDACKVLDSIFG